MDYKKFTQEDQKHLDKHYWTRLINSLSGFKSVNLIGTRSHSGVDNLSVISSCFHLGARPPLIGFVVRPHSNHSPRHTLMNLKETGCFSLNHIENSFYKKAHQTSARYDFEDSEFEKVKLTPEFLDSFQAPFVKESQFKVALKLCEVIDVKQNNTHIIVAEVEAIYVNNEAIKKDGYIDIELLDTVCVSGLDAYHQTQRLARLSYAKPNKAVEELSLDGDICI